MGDVAAPITVSTSPHLESPYLSFFFSFCLFFTVKEDAQGQKKKSNDEEKKAFDVALLTY